MVNIAAVIVDNSSRYVDREFDYLIPEELKEVIKVGMRVIVPFGRGDKFLEGYVVEIKTEDGVNGISLKSIFDIVGEEIIISSEMMELAKFLKKRYYATMRDALQALLPSGLKVKESLYIRKKTKFSLIGSEGYVNILDLLREDKYIEFKQLTKMLGKQISRASIFNMERLGSVEIKREMQQGVREKTIEIYTLGDLLACRNFVENYPPKQKRQAEVLEAILSSNEEGTITSLCGKYKCTRGVIKGLEEK